MDVMNLQEKIGVWSTIRKLMETYKVFRLLSTSFSDSRLMGRRKKWYQPAPLFLDRFHKGSFL